MSSSISDSTVPGRLTRSRAGQEMKEYHTKFGIGKIIKLKNDPKSRPRTNYDCNVAGTIEGISFEDKTVTVSMHGQRKPLTVSHRNIVFFKPKGKRKKEKNCCR